MDGIELTVFRLRVGFKQYELAQLLGVPATIICDLERGRWAITPEIENRIKQAIPKKQGSKNEHVE